MAQNSEQPGGLNDFTLIHKFPYGFRAREDITTLPPGVLVEGSQNVLTNTYQRVGIRKGYTLDGQANSDAAPIASAFDWTNSAGTDIHMRSGFLTSAGNDGKLQFRYVHSDDSVEWIDLLTGLSEINFNYTNWWNQSTLLSEVLFVNGTSNIFEWAGASAEALSGANPMGIIQDVTDPYLTSQISGTGGYDYVVGDTLTVDGGDSNATLTVLAVTTGAVSAAAVNSGGAGWSIGNTFWIGSANKITSISVAAGGTGYTVGDTFTITGGSASATGIVSSTTSTGVVNGVSIVNAGSGYSTGSAITTTRLSGAGTGLTVNITAVSSGVNSSQDAFCEVTNVSGGAVTAFTIIGNGYGYTTGSNIACTASVGGTGLTVDISAVSGGAITQWGFASDADHGTGYSASTSYDLTGGSGSNAKGFTSGITSGSITASGTATWAQLGFPFQTSSETTSIIINGTTYSYQSEYFIGDTTTLYGVTPDPSGISSGDVVVLGITTYANGTDLANLPTDYKQTLIGAINQRVFLGQGPQSDTQKNGGRVFVSKFNDFKTYGTSAIANVVGSAFQIFTTSAPTAFIPQEQFMYISAGKDEWYNVTFSLSTDLTYEIININRLNTTARQAAQSQAATNKNANSIVYLSFEPIIETFGRVVNILANNAPQITDLSYPIVNLMNSLDFTNAAVFYHRKFTYVAVPRESLVLMYNMTDPQNPYWEAPQHMPISRFSIIDGELYGHSSQVSETYKLFTGTNDNGAPIEADAVFSFNNYGTRTQTKGYNQFYVEGYISNNTDLEVGIQYDIDGCATTTAQTINGDDEQIVCLVSGDASLGKAPLGKNPLGGQLIAANNTPKFRVIKTFPTNYFYEDQISFSSVGLDEQWEIIGFGPQLLPNKSLNNEITQ